EKESSHVVVDVHGETISIENTKLFGLSDIGDSRERIKHFTFDHCYNSACSIEDPAYASQELIFQDLGTEVLQSAFSGYNVCVFAYGQTGTGKTYTMMGCPGEVGLIPRICEGLFSHVDSCAGGKVTCRVNISYYEIYNERVRDLLQVESRWANEKYTLKVREHPKQGPYVQDLSEHRVKDNEEIQSLLDRGNEFRTTAATYMHDHSSRSHAIVTINFTQAQLEENMPSEIVSKIHLVDLAGSERADPHFNSNFRERLKEGSNINKSLVTLGYVIKTLAERSLLSWSSNNMGSMQSFHSSGGGETLASPESGHRKQHAPYIPYRDSVLTWLLKDSLGGNSKTIMIATISPSSLYYSETINTLRYAQRAKIIVNKPHINEDPNVSIIRQLRQEIDRLHKLLASAQEVGSLVSIQETGSQIAEKLQENEVMANQLTKSWMTKWSETHDLIMESDMSIRGLGNRSSSMGVLIDSQLPYLIGMGADILSTGVHMYHLKEGKTVIGNEESHKEPDIVLTGPNILNEHCIIEHRDGTVTLYPLAGAHCTVQGVEVQKPTKLTQGDIIVLGGTQIFRFNNPSEAAKLREHRQSQGSLATDALSRASSFSSIGGDDSSRTYLSPHSQMMKFYPNYAAPDMCLNFEQKYQTEQERIEDARRELERLLAQIRQLEDARQEKEEEMWVMHDQHKQDIEEQKQHLAHLIRENQCAREQAEEEIRQTRENLKREKEAYYKQIQAEMERLKKLEQKEHRELAVQTETHQCTTSTSFDMEVETFSDDVDAAVDPSALARVRKKSVSDRMKELEQEELKRKLSDREMEICLAEQQEDIVDDFLQKEEQLKMKIRKMEEMEEEYKRLSVLHLKEISNQNEKLQELHKQSAMLEVYIEEKQDLINVGSHAPRPLRSARSEMFLTDPNLIEPKFSRTELQCGSEGDIAIASSLDFSVSYGAELQAMNSILSESMESSITSQSMESIITSQSSDLADVSSVLSTDSVERGAKPKKPLAKTPLKKLDKQKNPVYRGSEHSGTKPKKRLKKDHLEKNDGPKIPLDKNLKSVSSADEALKTADSVRSSASKDVISRLYQPPPPKFKYVPKIKEDKKREPVPRSRFHEDSPQRFPTHKDSDSQESSKKPLSHRKSSSQDSPQVVSQRRTPIKESPQQSSVQKLKSKADLPHPFRDGKTSGVSNKRVTSKNGDIKQHKERSQESSDFKKELDIPGPQSNTQSIDLTYELAVESSGRVSGRSRTQLLPRMTPSKLIHFPSASSLAIVPEVVNEAGEETDVLNLSARSESASCVVKRRNKGRSKNKEDEFRRHSEPVGEKLVDALERYKREIEQGLDMHRELKAKKSSSDEIMNESMSSLVGDGNNDAEISAFVSDSITGRTTESSSLFTPPQIIVTDDSDDSSTVENVPENYRYQMGRHHQAKMELSSICGELPLSHGAAEEEIINLALGDSGINNMNQIPLDGQHETQMSSALSPNYVEAFVLDRHLQGQILHSHEMDTQGVSKPGLKREHHDTKLSELFSLPTKISKTDASNFSQPFLFAMEDFSQNFDISFNAEARSDHESLDYESKQNMKKTDTLFNAVYDSDEEIFSDDSLDNCGRKKKGQREEEPGGCDLYDSLESSEESDSLKSETAGKVGTGINGIDSELEPEYSSNIQMDVVENEQESQNEFRSHERGCAVQMDIPPLMNQPAAVDLSAEPDIHYSSEEEHSKEFTYPVYGGISVESDDRKSRDISTTDGTISVEFFDKDLSPLEEFESDVTDSSNGLFPSSEGISMTKTASSLQVVILPNAVTENTVNTFTEATNTFSEDTNLDVGRWHGSYEEKNASVMTPEREDSYHEPGPDTELSAMSELSALGNQEDNTLSLDTICSAESFGNKLADDNSEAGIQVFTQETDGQRELLKKQNSQEQLVVDTKLVSSMISSELRAEEAYKDPNIQTSVSDSVINTANHIGDTDKDEIIAADFESGSRPVLFIEEHAYKAESPCFDSITCTEDPRFYKPYELTDDSRLTSGTHFVGSHSLAAAKSTNISEQEEPTAVKLTERSMHIEPVQNVIAPSADRDSFSTKAIVIRPGDNEKTSESYKDESDTIDLTSDIGLSPGLSENDCVQKQNMEQLSLMSDVGLHTSDMDAGHITGCDKLDKVCQISTHKGGDHVQSMQEDAEGSTSVSTDSDPNKPLHENSPAEFFPLSSIGNDLASLPTQTSWDKSVSENNVEPSMPMKLVPLVTNINITGDQQDDQSSSGSFKQDKNIYNKFKERDSSQKGFAEQTQIGERLNAAGSSPNSEISPCLLENQAMEVLDISSATVDPNVNELPSVDTWSEQKEHNADKRHGVDQATDRDMDVSLDELRPLVVNNIEGFSDDGRNQKSLYDGYLSDSRVQGRPDVPSFEKLQPMDRHRSLLDSGFIDHYDSPSQDTDTDSPEHRASMQDAVQEYDMKEEAGSAEENLHVSDQMALGKDRNGEALSIVRSNATAELSGSTSTAELSGSTSVAESSGSTSIAELSGSTSITEPSGSTSIAELSGSTCTAELTRSTSTAEQSGSISTAEQSGSTCIAELYDVSGKEVSEAGSSESNADTGDFDDTDEMKSNIRFTQGDTEQISEESVFNSSANPGIHEAQNKQGAPEEDFFSQAAYQPNTFIESFDHPNSNISQYPNADDLDLHSSLMSEASCLDVLIENNYSEREISLDNSGHMAAEAFECNTITTIGLPINRTENVDIYEAENNCTVVNNNVTQVKEPMKTNDQSVLEAISLDSLGDISPEKSLLGIPSSEQEESLMNTLDQNFVPQQLYSFEGTIPTSGSSEEMLEDLQVKRSDMDYVPMVEPESSEPLKRLQSPLMPPETRSLGVGTGQDLLDIKVSGDMGEDGHSQCSNDSLLDPHEELQVLQEELESLIQKSSVNVPQLSTARRAARQRAMIRQQQLTLDSELAGQLSDDSVTKGCKSKSSSRPGSGSRRRRRPQNKTPESLPRRLKNHSSEEYASSENDSIYSDESLHGIPVLPMLCDHNSLADKETHCLATTLSEFSKEDLGNNMNSKYKVNGWKDHRESDHEREDPGAKHGKRSMAVQTEDSFHPLLSPESTQTDPFEDTSISFYSDQYDASRYFVTSPLSVWSSNEQSESDSPNEKKRSTSSGAGVTHVQNMIRTPTPSSILTSERKTSNLDKGPTEVWSTSSFDLRTRSTRGENSYTMETESISPSIGVSDSDESRIHRSLHNPVTTHGHNIRSIHTPITTHGHNISQDQVFNFDSDRILHTSTPSQQDNSVTNMVREVAPIKFEVTVHENETNIVYNVEKTDYRTYPLRSGSETSDVFVPDTIHVNLRESVSSERDERHHSYHSERIHFRGETDSECDDVITFERTYNASYSAQRDTSQENDTFVRDETKEAKCSTENNKVSCELGASSYSSKEHAFELQNHLGMDGEIAQQEEIQMTDASVQPYTENSNIPTEYDSTSDYGTITSVDGRRGLLSFTSDSDDVGFLSPPNISPRGSYSHSQTEELINDVDAVSVQRIPYLPLHSRRLEIQMQEKVEINPEDQNLYSSDDVTTLLVAEQMETSFPVQFVSEPSTQLLKSQEEHPVRENNCSNDPLLMPIPMSVELDSLDITGQQSSEDLRETILEDETRILLQQQQQTQQLNTDLPDDNNQTVIPQDEYKLMDLEIMKNPETPESNKKGESSVESADERYFSQECLECTESESSEYMTPQQSPRNSSQESLQIEELAKVLDVHLNAVTLKDVERNPHAAPREVSPPQPKFSKSLPQRSATVRTVSVNTDAPTAFTRKDVSGIANKDPSALERKRKELERKIAHLQRHVRSLSDSAISSDYTDGDSASLSPRPSRFCETDQSFRFPVHSDTGLIHSRVYHVTQSPIKMERASDFEGSVSKMTFNDSGNVYDESLDSDGHSSIPSAVLSSEHGIQKPLYGAKSLKISKHSSLDKPNANVAGQEMESGAHEHTAWHARSSITERSFIPVRHEVGKFPERLTDALLAVKPYPIQRSASLDSLSELMKMGPSLSRALRSSKSIEPTGDGSEPKSIGEINRNTLDLAKGSNSSGHETSDDFTAAATADKKQMKNVVGDDDQSLLYKLRSPEETKEEGSNQQSEDSMPPTIDDGFRSMDMPLLRLDTSSSNHSEQRSHSPGEIDLGSESLEDMMKIVDTDEIDFQTVGSDGYKDLYIRRKMLGRSQSLPEFTDYHSSNYQRSLSEGCINEYDDQNNSSGSSNGSNDSITFVFVTKFEKGDLNFLHDDKGEVGMILLDEEGPKESESPFSGHSPAPAAEDGEITLALTDTSSSSQTEESRFSEEEQVDANDYDKGPHKFSVDDKPLKHRYGIDESVLPMPERSMSCDNLPKHVSKHENIHRSRSTSMLNVGAVEDPNANEGIFPPTLDNVDEDSQTYTIKTMSDGRLDQGSLRTKTPEVNTEQFSKRTSSEMKSESSDKEDSAQQIHSLAKFQNLSSSDQEIFEEITIKYSIPDNATQNLSPEIHSPPMAKSGSTESNLAAAKEMLRTVKEFIFPKLTLIDRGMSTEDESSRFVSADIQVSLTETASQTDVIIPGTNEIILPVDAASHQSLDHESDDFGHHLSRLIISENSANWLNLGEIMQDTKRLLQRINERIPETSISTPSSQSDENLTVIQQLQEVSVQTGGSLTNLQSVGLQTDDEIEMFTIEAESQPESTQTDPYIQMKALEQSETIVSDLLPGTTETIACEICIEADEKNKAINVIETMEISIQTDEVRPSTENEDKPEIRAKLMDLLPSGTNASRIAHYLVTEPICNNQHESETSSDVSYMRQTVFSVPLEKDLKEKKSLSHEIDKVNADKVDTPSISRPEELQSQDLHRPEIHLIDQENKDSMMDNELTAEQKLGKTDSVHRIFGCDDLLENINMMTSLPHGMDERQVEEERSTSVMSKNDEDPLQTSTMLFPSENDLQPGSLRNISAARTEAPASVIVDKFTQIIVPRGMDGEDMINVSIQDNIDPVNREEKKQDGVILGTDVFITEDISYSDTAKEDQGVPTSGQGRVNDFKVSSSLAVEPTWEEVQEIDLSSLCSVSAPSFYIMPNNQQQQEQHVNDSYIKDDSNNEFPRSRSNSKSSSSSENTTASAEVAEFMDGYLDKSPDICKRSGAHNSSMLEDNVEDVVDDVLSDVSTPRGSGKCSPTFLYENNYEDKDVPCMYREVDERQTRMVDSSFAGPINFRHSGGPSESKSTQEETQLKLLRLTKSVLDKFVPPSASKRLIARQIDEETVLPQMKEEMQSDSMSSCLSKTRSAEVHTKDGTTQIKQITEDKDGPEKLQTKQELPYSDVINHSDDIQPQVEETIIQQKAKARNLGPSLADLVIKIQESCPKWRMVPTHVQHSPEEQLKSPSSSSSSQNTQGTSSSHCTENTITTHTAERRNLSPGFTEYSVLMPATYHEKMHAASAGSTAADALNESSQSQETSQEKQIPCPKSELNEFAKPLLVKELVERQIKEKGNKGRPTYLSEVEMADAHTRKRTLLMKETVEDADDPGKNAPKQQSEMKPQQEETFTQQKTQTRNFGTDLRIRRQESYPELNQVTAYEQIRQEEQPKIPSSSQSDIGISRSPVIDNLVTSQKRNIGLSFTEKKTLASSPHTTVRYTMDKSPHSEGSSQPKTELARERTYLDDENGKTVQLNRVDPVLSRPSQEDVQSNRNILYRRTSAPNSTGVEVSVDSLDDSVQASVDISDEFTQTDVADSSMDAVTQMGDENDGPSRSSLDSPGSLKQELERLQNERLQILKLLSLSYLPSSLTVELLEAKLNYCIGQTDLLLNSLDDTWDAERKSASLKRTPSSITREYLSKYKHDLKQSKKDMEMCKERIERQKGTGRGRPIGRNRDIFRIKRQAEIEAFKLERMREEHDYLRSKSSTPVRDPSPQVTPRQESPRSYSSGPHSFKPCFMSPRQRKEHLINLRRQLVHLVESDNAQNKSILPSTPSQGCRRIILPHRADTSLSYSPKISVSVSDLTDSQDINTYSLPPEPSTGERSVSLDSVVTVTHSYRPRLRSPGMEFDTIANRGSYCVQPTSASDKKTTIEGFYSMEESAQILKEIEEIKKRNRTEIESATEMLRRTTIDSGSRVPRINKNTTHSPGYRTPQSQTFHSPQRNSSVYGAARSNPEYGTPRSQPQHQSTRELDSGISGSRSECFSPRMLDEAMSLRDVSPHSQTSGSPGSFVPRLILSVDASSAQRQSLLDPGMYSPYSAYARGHLSQHEQHSGGILQGTYELYSTPSRQHTITPEEFPTLSGTTLQQSPSTSRHDRIVQERLHRTRPITAYDVRTRLADKTPNG
ncbi:hypothetical protein ACJMK2_037627, partial [Sinanodonta woodiana]